MKITHKEYEDALEIVRNYQNQINAELSFLETPLVEQKKQLIDVVVGDFITPLKTSRTNGHCWTIGKKYKVLKVDKSFDYYDKNKEQLNRRKLVVKNDQGKLNKIRISGSHGYHNYDAFTLTPTDKWLCV